MAMGFLTENLPINGLKEDLYGIHIDIKWLDG